MSFSHSPSPRPKPPQRLVNHLVCLAPELLHRDPGTGARGPLNRCPGCANQNVRSSTNSALQKPLGRRPQGPLSGYVAWRLGGHCHCLWSDCLQWVQTCPPRGRADAPQPMAVLMSSRLLSLHLLPAASNVQPWSLRWGRGEGWVPLEPTVSTVWLQSPVACLYKARSEP